MKHEAGPRKSGKSFWVIGISLTLALILGHDAGWRGSAELHTVMETVATLLAAIVGAMALVRYYSKKHSVFLFVGVGFLGTAFLDGYHAIVTSTYFKPMMPSDLPALIPWSWVASRQFLSIVMFLSWLAWRREEKLGDAGKISERAVYLSTAIFTLVSFCFFAFVPLPRAYYPEIMFHRPEEFAPALFFMLALIGYLKKGQWRSDAFEYWLVLSLLVGFLGQAFFMSHSSVLFDFDFDVAHSMKKVSYLLVLSGLLISMFQAFKREEKTVRELDFQRLALDEHAIVSITDVQGNITYANDQFCETSGYDLEELMGQNHRILKSGEHSMEFYKDFWRTIAGGKPWHGEIKNKKKDGGHYWVKATMVPFLDEHGKPFRYTAIRTDITEQKAAEQALRDRETELKRSNEELENFAYVASHDLKAPLRAIDSLASWIAEDLEGKLDEGTAENLGLMKARVRRMEGLLEGLLAYSRVGHANCEVEQIDSRELLTTMLKFMDLPEGFSVEVGDDMPTIESERPPLELVFRNLIRNAVKHHDGDSGRIVITGQQHPALCEFTVSDDGPGIPEEFQDRVFGMFQTLKPRDEVEGSGMGLALVRKAVEQNNGNITIVSEGRGSEFRFTWLNQPYNGESS